MNRAARRRHRRLFGCDPPEFGRDHRCQSHLPADLLDGTSTVRDWVCPCGKPFHRVDCEGARWWSPVLADGSLAAPPVTDRPRHLELLRTALVRVGSRA